MRARHGYEPKGPRLPLRARLALWWLGKKLEGVKPMEVSMLWKKLIVSLVYGIGATGAVLSVVLQDSTITGTEWMALLSAFAAAGWGKFSSNTTVVAPSRKGETITGPES